MQRLLSLYKTYKGFDPVAVEPINGSGSNRSYYRLRAADGDTLIGVVGTSVEENEAFFHIAQCLRANGLNVPTVVAVSRDRRCYLQNDLGSRSLFDALRTGREAGGRYDEAQCRLLERAIEQLPRLQLLGARGMDFSKCYPQPAMDKTTVLFDLNYFKYCFLKPSGIDFNELRLERDFQAFAEYLIGYSPLPEGFLYRDFQARNVMLDANDEPWFIDFQGGRQGQVYYDLASFLWQASARYPDALRRRLTDVYLRSLMQVIAEMKPKTRKKTKFPFSMEHEYDPIAFKLRLGDFVLLRLLQVLGAYGYRGYFERKQHFIDSIPPAIENLEAILQQCSHLFGFPELYDVLNRLCASYVPSSRGVCEGSQGVPSSHGSVSLASPASATSLTSATSLSSPTSSTSSISSLRVRVFSFSYKRGIPEDESGNGGGYVFDCRSTNNPGRYAEYKQLTGLDEPVISFLEKDGEILRFLESVYPLADFHVARYIQRGFTDLMFSFGCTGGQHRSVYCAQHLAEHIHRKFGIRVSLCHREQGITQEFQSQVSEVQSCQNVRSSWAFRTSET